MVRYRLKEINKSNSLGINGIIVYKNEWIYFEKDESKLKSMSDILIKEVGDFKEDNLQNKLNIRNCKKVDYKKLSRSDLIKFIMEKDIAIEKKCLLQKKIDELILIYKNLNS